MKGFRTGENFQKFLELLSEVPDFWSDWPAETGKIFSSIVDLHFVELNFLERSNPA